ncbi:beta strand repeat-containing protein [Alicyclobacillus vulcanalis]|uniref:Big-1 domain-containing protein n=1 Tax=Alicyclobacillus vulcanalis TaxID=252246 RepID=A0A1N7PEI1_9BACL|nr:hypothetical protein [Alicyclobacillus vulcanalis]SIT09045.1 hypothetical protein SAMN05421799_1135 [Alicyclobacillus vulcanalis]
MKRTLSGIASAAIVLGAISPVAFADTSSGLTQGNALPITVNGQIIAVPYEMVGVDSGNQTGFFPIYYFDEALAKLGIQATWNGTTHVWALTDSNITNPSSVQVAGGVGTGNTQVTLNGTLIKEFNTQAAKDPAGGPNAQVTTYMPIYYVSNILQALNINGKFSGQTGLQLYSAQPGLAVKVSGVTTGNGTAANPYLNTTGDTATVWLQLADANGNPVANAPVSLTFSGGSGAPTVEQNNSYATVTAGSNGTYTAQVTTDANGTATFVVTGQGAYTLTIAGTGQYAGSSQTIYLTLANNTPVIVAGNTSPTVSTASNITQGLVPVTVTVPGASANQQVTFYLAPASGSSGQQAHFVNSQGAAIGSSPATGAPTGSYEEYIAYTNSSGQATVYVNSYYAGNYTVYAVTGSGSSQQTVSTTIDYQAPASSSTTSVAGLSVSGAAPSYNSTNSDYVAANVTNISGVSTGTPVYVSPLSSTSSSTDAVVTNASVTYTLQLASGQTLGSLYFDNGKGTGTASSWAASSATLPTSATAAGATVQLTATYTSGSGYSWAVNGVTINGLTTTTPVFGFTVSGAGQVTITSGSAKATASFVAGPQTPAYVGYANPYSVNLGTQGLGSGTLQFEVFDTNGNPVANQSVPVVLADEVSDLMATGGLWITAVNGTVLQTNIGGSNYYTPIYLNSAFNKNSTGTVVSGSVSPAGYTSVSIPGVVSWQAGQNSSSSSTANSTMYVTTNAQGDVSLTFGYGNVPYYTGSGLAYSPTYNAPSVTSTTVNLYTTYGATTGGTLLQIGTANELSGSALSTVVGNVQVGGPGTVQLGTFAESGSTSPYTYTATVTVLNSAGNPVTGLTASNFTVKDTTANSTLSAGTSAGDYSISGGTNGQYTLTIYESSSTNTDSITVTVNGITSNSENL